MPENDDTGLKTGAGCYIVAFIVLTVLELVLLLVKRTFGTEAANIAEIAVVLIPLLIIVSIALIISRGNKNKKGGK